MALGGLRARFGGPRASILKGSGDDLSRFSDVLGFVSLTWSLHRRNANNTKKGKNAKNEQTANVLPRNAEPKVNLCCTFLAVGPGAVDCQRQLGLDVTS